MSLSRLRFEYFTVYSNVLVGANATGKTHLMKVAYAACDTAKTRLDFAEKLVRVFLQVSFSNHATVPESATVKGLGVQVFLATYNYIILNELDLRRRKMIESYSIP